MTLLYTRALTAAHLHVRYRNRTVIWKLRAEPWDGFEGRWYAFVYSPGNKIWVRKIGRIQFSMWTTYAKTLKAAADQAKEAIEAEGREVVRIEMLVDDKKVVSIQTPEEALS